MQVFSYNFLFIFLLSHIAFVYPCFVGTNYLLYFRRYTHNLCCWLWAGFFACRSSLSQSAHHLAAHRQLSEVAFFWAWTLLLSSTSPECYVSVCRGLWSNHALRARSHARIMALANVAWWAFAKGLLMGKFNGLVQLFLSRRPIQKWMGHSLFTFCTASKDPAILNICI